MVLRPSAVATPEPLFAVGAGWFHSLSVAFRADVWAWGWNAGGQVGDGSTADRLTPVIVA